MRLQPIWKASIAALVLALSACAHQPPRAPQSTAQLDIPFQPASAAPATDLQPPAAAPSAQVEQADSAPALEASVSQSVSEVPAAAGPVDSEGLPGPPPDSVVVAREPDLFARLRSGFQLSDVQEPAVSSQLNWFANHPDFLERTWGRASLWLYYIVGQIEQRKMPAELALLPVIESAFEPYAYSRARAAGLWQFISDTGHRFGLKQDYWYDGRRDPIEATRAALDYLQELHDEFNGDWLLAVAAYNCGELAVERAIERNQRLGKPTDFWHLKLPTETRGYVPELLAMRRLVSNPERFGLEFSPIPNEPYFITIQTGGQIDLKVVAQMAGVTADDLYELNPAFHRWATDPTGPYHLLVPADSAEGLQQAVLQLTPEQRMSVEHYTVRHGDTIASIATHFRTRPEVIRELNDLDANELPVIDTSLRVPSPDIQLPEKAARAALLADAPPGRLRRHGGKPRIHVVRRGDTLYALAQRLGTDPQTLAQINGLNPGDRLRAGQKLRMSSSNALVASAPSRTSTKTASSGSAADGARRMTYVVRRGDTLYSIARLLQVTVSDLADWNGVSGNHSLKPGQILIAFVKSRT
ncbi:MAG TPA: LysM peptidoglycan-binding domain-containing protein [Steroidobacteraceae bacterium]|nr:LysM peptidoglycan-binding domain-containing protein [Steroidobacteraceae bacterium]